jgi:hypothetical protein
VRHEFQPVPVLGEGELPVERVGGNPGADQLRAGVFGPGDGDGLEGAVGVDVVDDRDPEA